MRTPLNNIPLDIATEIKSLQGGVRLPWGRVSSLLVLVEQQGYWRDEATSFTRWVNSHAVVFGSKPATLWRLVASGKYYEKFRAEYPHFFPYPLHELPDQVSPENIELLYKLSRVAPKDLFGPLIEKVMCGRITRSELRTAWVRFRPALEGQTARGKGVTPPKLSVQAGKESELLTEALILHRLLGGSSEWTGLKNLTVFKPYSELECSDVIRFDAVIVTKGKQSRLLFHGIEVLKRLYPHSADKLKSLQLRCDLMWVVLPQLPQGNELQRLPDNVGLIVVDSDVQVIRPARLEPGHDTCALAKAILERELKG